MSALAVILGMIGAMFSVKHTASSIEKTSDGDAKEAKEAAQKVQEGNKDISLSNGTFGNCMTSCAN